jgi:hypothetical protein
MLPYSPTGDAAASSSRVSVSGGTRFNNRRRCHTPLYSFAMDKHAEKLGDGRGMVWHLAKRNLAKTALRARSGRMSAVPLARFPTFLMPWTA